MGRDWLRFLMAGVFCAVVPSRDRKVPYLFFSFDAKSTDSGL